jgi:hypothetical protein
MNDYAAINPTDLSDRLVRGLDEKAGYILVRPETEQIQPQYFFTFSIEADGRARKINPAITLIYQTSDDFNSRKIMKSKRVRDDDLRIPALEALIDSAVNSVPNCPTWKRDR